MWDNLTTQREEFSGAIARAKAAEAGARREYLRVMRDLRHNVVEEIVTVDGDSLPGLRDEFEASVEQARDLRHDIERYAKEAVQVKAELQAVEYTQDRYLEQMGDIVRSYGWEGLGEDEANEDEDTETIWQTLIEDGIVQSDDEHHYYVVVQAAAEYLQTC